MPSASSFTNKVRAVSEGRNTKIQYNGGVTQSPNPLGALTCIPTPDWWVTTKYQEVPKTSSPSTFPIITNLLARINNIRGKVILTWDLKLPCVNSVLIECIVKFYTSDNNLIETARFPSGGLQASSSVTLICGYSYYAIISLAGISTISNTVYRAYNSTVSSYNFSILTSPNIFNLAFTTSYPTSLTIKYYRNNINATYSGTLIDTFTINPMIDSHTYTALSAGYWYATIQPTRSIITTTVNTTTVNTLAYNSTPTIASLVANSGALTLALAYSLNIESPVSIYYYSSTESGLRTLIGTHDVYANKGSNIDILTNIPFAPYYYATVYGIGNSASISI